MDGTGTAIAVWQQKYGDHKYILTNRFDGTAWGTADLIKTDNYPSTGGLQIAMDGTGTAIAVWSQWEDSARMDIWANRFYGTAWSAAELIETVNGGVASDPKIAMDNTGRAIAVWQHYDGNRYNIWANRFDGAAWDTAERIETGISGGLQIAMDSTGTAIAVYQKDDGTRNNIWAYRFE